LGQHDKAGKGARPLHRHVPALSCVAGGAIFGAAARDALEQAIPTPGSGLPIATGVINLLGAFLLGALLEALARAGDDRGRRRRLRLTFGTGFLGAFTTYSTFALETDQLVQRSHALLAVGYVAVSVLGGLLAVVAGVVVAGGRRRPAVAARPVDPDLETFDPDLETLEAER
jgi:CrcB protein